MLGVFRESENKKSISVKHLRANVLWCAMAFYA